MISRSMRLALFATSFALVAGAGCDGCDDGPGEAGDEGEDSWGPTADDIDGDGILNVDDGDVDGDGINNAVDLDIDGDFVPNDQDDDVDGDGVSNGEDDSAWGANPDDVDGPFGDNDGDGLPNGLDSDDDGDGLPDGVEGQGDCNGDGIAEDENNDCDGFCLELESGFLPCDDGSPAGTGTPDLDGDGTPDTVDPDDDADGLPDDSDDQPGGSDPCVGLEAPPPPECFPPEDPPPGDPPGDPPPGDPPPGPVCTTETFDPQAPIPPRILLVVDRSASMEEAAPGFSGSKWIATREALVGPLFGSDDGVVGQLEARVEMGLFVYPADNADDVCAPGQLVRAIHLENHGSIKTALYLTEPTGATPTAVSLSQAKNVLDFLDEDGGQRAIILATDGGPNCNRSLDGDTCRCVGTREQCQQYPANCLDDTNAVGAAAALQAAGYPVYVLGISGTEDFADVLTAMAQAGGTNDYYPVSSSANLASSIEAIATDVGSCRFDLSGFPDAADLTVRIDGSVVAHDPSRTSGWDLVGFSTLEFFGASCSQSHAGSSITVERCE